MTMEGFRMEEENVESSWKLKCICSCEYLVGLRTCLFNENEWKEYDIFS
jgi:hypothetical protein